MYPFCKQAEILNISEQGHLKSVSKIVFGRLWIQEFGIEIDPFYSNPCPVSEKTVTGNKEKTYARHYML